MRTADCESSVRTDSAPYKWPLATAKDSSSGQIKHVLKCDFLLGPWPKPYKPSLVTEERRSAGMPREEIQDKDPSRSGSSSQQSHLKEVKEIPY